MTESAQLHYGRQARSQNWVSMMPRALTWLGYVVVWASVGAFALGAMYMLSALTIGPATGYLAPVGAILMLAAGATLFRGMRRTWDLAALAYLEQSVRLNLPLPPMLDAAARSEGGPVARRLLRLRSGLEDGRTVADALATAAPSLPGRVIGLVAAGENTGRLGPAMRRIVASPRRLTPAPDPTNSIFYRWYPLVLLAFGAIVVQMLVVFVFPKYRQIFSDFGVEPAPVMRWTASVPDWLPVATFATAALAVLAFCGRSVLSMFAPRIEGIGAAALPLDALLWRMPVAGGVLRSRALGDACHVIADALEAGVPLPVAIAEAEAVPNNAVLRRRLGRWATAVTNGAPVDTAARDVAMPALLVGMLGAGQGSAGLPETFRFLARYYDARFSAAATLLRAAIMPALAIGFGAIVLVLALSVMQPLVDLMNHLVAGPERI